MTEQETIIKRIQDFASQEGWNRFKLATEADLAERTLRSLYKKTFNPTLCTLLKVIRFIDEHERSLNVKISNGQDQP